jgi:hypothetical protein
MKTSGDSLRPEQPVEPPSVFFYRLTAQATFQQIFSVYGLIRLNSTFGFRRKRSEMGDPMAMYAV